MMTAVYIQECLLEICKYYFVNLKLFTIAPMQPQANEGNLTITSDYKTECLFLTLFCLIINIMLSSI
jgi:hypothetical protein